MLNVKCHSMNLIKHKNIFLVASTALVMISWTLVILFGFKEGVDLKGGTEWRVRLEQGKTEEEVRSVIQSIEKGSVAVKKSEDETFILRLKTLGEVEHAEYLKQ